MGKQEKLLARLLSKPKDFTWNELCSLMKHYGFELLKANGGGSGRKFYCDKTKSLVIIHEPHPGNIIKRYSIDDIIIKLKDVGVIEGE